MIDKKNGDQFGGMGKSAICWNFLSGGALKMECSSIVYRYETYIASKKRNGVKHEKICGGDDDKEKSLNFQVFTI